MIASARQIAILMLAVALLSLGHGLNGSLVGVRASAQDFSTVMTGLIMSGYFAGLLVSASVTPRIVQSVGHIRVFAGFASVVSSVVLLFPLWINPIWWLALRFVTGLCTSGLFIVCESWLNSASTNQNRGTMLSIYMVVSYAAMGGGQLLLNVADGSGFSRFIIVSALSLPVPGAPVIGADRNAEPCRNTSRVGWRNLSCIASCGRRDLRQWVGAKCLLQHGGGIRRDAGPGAALCFADDGAAAHRGDHFAVSGGYPLRRYDRRTVIMAFSIAAVVVAAIACLAASSNVALCADRLVHGIRPASRYRSIPWSWLMPMTISTKIRCWAAAAS